MEPVGVTLTQQQAMLLLPLLQQIASGSPQGMASPSGSTTSSSSSSGGTSSPPFFVPKRTTDHGYSTDGSESACKYSVDELFQTKMKNSKSSDAHNFSHVSLCCECVCHIKSLPAILKCVCVCVCVCVCLCTCVCVCARTYVCVRALYPGTSRRGLVCTVHTCVKFCVCVCVCVCVCMPHKFIMCEFVGSYLATKVAICRLREGGGSSLSWPMMNGGQLPTTAFLIVT